MAEIFVASEPNNPRLRIFKVAINAVVIGRKGREPIYGSPIMLWPLAEPLDTVLQSHGSTEYDLDINEHTRAISITLKKGRWDETLEDAITAQIKLRIHARLDNETVAVKRVP